MEVLEEKRGVFLKEFQKTAIKKIVEGKDVFVCVPTGFGKSFCYVYLPQIFLLSHKTRANIFVISPLIALMKDQVESCTLLGISAALVGEGQDDPTVKQDAKLGKYEVSKTLTT